MEGARLVTKEDLGGIIEVLNSSGLFPVEYLDDMVADYLTNPDSGDIWFAYVVNDTVVGFGYCAPEKLANAAYNLYAIAVNKALQGKGIGQKMIAYMEQLLKGKQIRLLIIETSSNEQYAMTRQFYIKLGYRQEAIIHDFWNEGEDKVIFWKKLN